MSRNHFALAVVACLAVGALTACGADDSDDDGASTDLGGLKGTPLKLSVAAFLDTPFGSLPDLYAGAQVAAENINADGGVNGRPIEIVTCNGKADAKGEEACAREAVDSDAIASVSNVFQVNAAAANQILADGGLTSIAGVGGDPTLYSLPTMYPIDFPAATFNGCASPEALAAVGDDTSICAFVGQNPFAEGVFSLAEPYLQGSEVGDHYAGSVSVPATQQDFNPVVQELDDKGANYVMVDIDPGSAGQVVTTAGSAGKDWSYCGDGGLFGPALLQQLAPVTKSFLTVVGLPPENSGNEYPLIKQFVDEMHQAVEDGNKDASIDVNHTSALRAWLGVQIFKEVAASIDGDVTRESFAEAMKTAKVDLGYAQIDFSKPLGNAPYERVFQPEAFITRWNEESSELDEVGQVNLLDLLVH